MQMNSVNDPTVSSKLKPPPLSRSINLQPKQNYCHGREGNPDDCSRGTVMSTAHHHPRELFLRNRILDRYTSLRQFAICTDISYSSVLTLLTRGIGGASFDTVMRICHALDIEPDYLYSINEQEKPPGLFCKKFRKFLSAFIFTVLRIQSRSVHGPHPVSPFQQQRLSYIYDQCHDSESVPQMHVPDRSYYCLFPL